MMVVGGCKQVVGSGDGDGGGDEMMMVDEAGRAGGGNGEAGGGECLMRLNAPNTAGYKG
jgi:hypothetical protein